MKTLVLAGHKETWAYEIPEHSFKTVCSALTRFCILWRKPSQARQMEFLDALGFKRQKAKLTRQGVIKFSYYDEPGMLPNNLGFHNDHLQ